MQQLLQDSSSSERGVVPGLEAAIRQYDAIIRRHAESSGSEFLDVQAHRWIHFRSEPFAAALVRMYPRWIERRESRFIGPMLAR